MNITKETAPVGARLLVKFGGDSSLSNDADVVSGVVKEWSPQGRLHVRLDGGYSCWIPATEKTIIEILEPLTNERDIDALLNTLRELFDDTRWTALGIRVRLARILTDFGLPTDPPNE